MILLIRFLPVLLFVVLVIPSSISGQTYPWEEKSKQAAPSATMKQDEKNADMSTSILRQADILRKGEGEKQDFGRALELYLQAADEGSAKGQYWAGWMYFKGLGVARDYQRAHDLFLKAAGQGHIYAHSNLGMIYEREFKDLDKAFSHYLSAAEKGLRQAQFKVGYFYAQGWSVERNYQKAREWYEKAADQGVATAMNNLGVLYENGIGVTKDIDKARAYYRKASDLGNAKARKNLDQLPAP